MHRINIADIIVGDRIRKTDDKYCVELARSIRDNGLLHPIVLRRDNRIIAGGHRYRAFQLLSLGEVESEDPTFYESVPFLYFEEYLVEQGKIKEGDTLPDSELRKMEIEENIRRKDMVWWERLFGVVEYHKTCGREARQLGDEWTQAMTGELLGLSQAHVSSALTIYKLMHQEEHRAMYDLPSLTAAIQYQAELKLREGVAEQQRRAQIKRQEILDQAKSAGTLRETAAPQTTGPIQASLPLDEGPKYSADFINGMFLEDDPTECDVLLCSPFDRVTEETVGPVLDMCDWKYAVIWCYITHYGDIYADLKESTEDFTPLPAAFHWIDNSAGISSAAMMPNKVHTAIILRRGEHQFTRNCATNYMESPTPTTALRHLVSLLTIDGTVYDPFGNHHWAAAAAALENRIAFLHKSNLHESLKDKISSTLNNNIPSNLGNAKSPFASIRGALGL